MCVEGAVGGERQHQVRRDRHVRHRRRVLSQARTAQRMRLCPATTTAPSAGPVARTTYEQSKRRVEICESCGVQAAGGVTESLLIAQEDITFGSSQFDWWCVTLALGGGRAMGAGGSMPAASPAPPSAR